MKKVAVIMGSDSDWPVVKSACQQLADFGIPYEALNGAKNAAVLAAQILAVSDDTLAAKLDAARADMAAQIEAKEAKLQAELG